MVPADVPLAPKSAGNVAKGAGRCTLGVEIQQNPLESAGNCSRGLNHSEADAAAVKIDVQHTDGNMLMKFYNL